MNPSIESNEIYANLGAFNVNNYIKVIINYNNHNLVKDGANQAFYCTAINIYIFLILHTQALPWQCNTLLLQLVSWISDVQCGQIVM